MAKRRGKRPVTKANSLGEGNISIVLTQGPPESPEKEGNQTLSSELEKESELLEEEETAPVLAEEKGQLKTKDEGVEKGEVRLWSDLFRSNREGEKGLKLQKVEEEGEEVIITREDVEPEVRFWQNSLIAYIIGQVVPVNAMVNFLRFRWKGLVMTSVIKHDDGYFILRFECQRDMEAALAKGMQFFYSKPLIIRKWSEGIPKQEEMRVLPIWIQLPKLPLGYWGASTLNKIVSKIGEPIRTDELTAKKMKIEYARILVKVDIDKDLPEKIAIKSEAEGYSFSQEVRYEWLPICCKKCRKWGHKEEICSKPVTKQWQVKKTVEMKEKSEMEEHIVIGKETVPIAKQGARVEMKGREGMRLKEADKGKQEESVHDKQGKESAEELMQNLLQMLSKGKGMEIGEPSRPPDL